MSEFVEMVHADGRVATPGTATDRVTLEAMGFRALEVKSEVPSESWSHDRLDEAAVRSNVDLAGARTKAEKVAALTAPDPVVVTE